jgi:hypothetical protein
VLLSSASLTQAATIPVTPATFAQGLAQLCGGDTLSLAPGTYPVDNLTLPSGSPGAPTVLQAQGGPVILSGTGCTNVNGIVLLKGTSTAYITESAKLWGDSGMLGGDDRMSSALSRVILPKKMMYRVPTEKSRVV